MFAGGKQELEELSGEGRPRLLSNVTNCGKDPSGLNIGPWTFLGLSSDVPRESGAVLAIDADHTSHSRHVVARRSHFTDSREPWTWVADCFGQLYLRINLEKTVAVRFTRNTAPFSLNMDGKRLLRSPGAKHLGLYLDSR